ncbi:MAG: 23S rRNA (uracil(1939)-C(5))-methyltransferase RlmD [bacterium]|nr:23S rRNA (uracil(1939)-C(5))-methyltransferase RlmD [bacterium]
MISEGLSLGRLGQGIKVMVPYGVKDDVVEIKVVKKKKDYWIGAIRKVITPSPLRTVPRCPYFGKCGGCQWQMIDYRYQPELKKELVIDALSHLAGINEVEVLDTVPSPRPFNYRNKVHFPLKRISYSSVIMGFYKQDTHYIIDVNECPLHLPQFNEIFKKAKSYIGKKGLSIYDEVKHTGFIRNFTLRGSERTQETLIVIVSKGEYLHKSTAIDLAKMGRNVLGVVENINPEKGNTIFGRENRTLVGTSLYHEKIKNYTFVISATSFFQVNTWIAEKMVDALDGVMQGIGEVDVIADAYSGVGLFAIASAKFARKVYALEISPESVSCAQRNIVVNNKPNVEIINGDAEGLLPTLGKVDVLILDPPRRGVGDGIVDFLANSKPPHILYFSCNPATLARDLKKMVDVGYKIEFIQPFDMFPQTFHVENLVYLKR